MYPWCIVSFFCKCRAFGYFVLCVFWVPWLTVENGERGLCFSAGLRRGEARRGVTNFMRGGSRMTIDPRIPTMPETKHAESSTSWQKPSLASIQRKRLEVFSESHEG